jgi:hypothetical protein
MVAIAVADGSIAGGQSIRWNFWWPNQYAGLRFVQAIPFFGDISLEVTDLTVTDSSFVNSRVWSCTVVNRGTGPSNYALFAVEFD